MKLDCIRVLMIIMLTTMIALTGSVLMAQQDKMILDSSNASQNKGRPAVTFFHNRHVEAGLDCKACHHLYQKGKNILDESQLVEGNPAIRCSQCHAAQLRLNVQQAFHSQCIGCHVTYQKEKKKTVPRYCGECHARK
ncbi:MAG: cytochrome c3 family protein [Deltaproteobacteria bacterium]|nr:cytochrome c3 family protein [Deltaproteobacteria bacterium]